MVNYETFEGCIRAMNSKYFLVEKIDAIENLDLRRMTATIETSRRGMFHREKVNLSRVKNFNTSDIDSIFGFCLLVRR